MAYKLEHSGEEQKKLLSSTLQKWGNCQPDVYLVSTEGHKIYTQRILLGLNSSLIDQLLDKTSQLGDLPGISVPASSGCLVNLLKILSTGVAISDNKLHLLEAAKAAECIGIRLENCQIGVKKKKPQSIIPVGDKSSPDSNKRKLVDNSVITKRSKVEKVSLDTFVKQEVDENDENESNQEMYTMHGYKQEVQKKHQCDHCDKSFTTRQAMLRHALAHSDNPTPFACDRCEKKFDRKYRLDKHKKTAHEDMVEFDHHDLLSGHEEELQLNMLERNETDQNAEESMSQEDGMRPDSEIKDDASPSEINDVECLISEINEDGCQSEINDDGGQSETPDVSDPTVKQKLLEDRQKLLDELNTMEGQEDLEFLNDY